MTVIVQRQWWENGTMKCMHAGQAYEKDISEVENVVGNTAYHAAKPKHNNEVEANVIRKHCEFL